jgi:hypothetical protein
VNSAAPCMLFTALPQQLGLKLEARKTAVELFMIDHNRADADGKLSRLISRLAMIGRHPSTPAGN